MQIHPSILRAYDIRGTFGTNLFEETAIILAKKFKTLLQSKEQKDEYIVVVGRDGRHSSPALHKALTENLLKVGCHVIDIGIASSPMLYFTEKTLRPDGAIMITASHNPKGDNGFKMMAFGKGIFGEEIQNLAKHDEAEKTKTPGHYKEISFLESYIAHNLKAIQEPELLKNIKVAWDFSGGAVCVAKALIQSLPGTHILINNELDPDFSAHEPDPTLPENLVQLGQVVRDQQCDLGIAFDGDGDRVSVVNTKGEMIAGDRLTTILAKEILKENPGATVLADVKSSRVFSEVLTKLGGKPLLTRTGHSYIKAKLQETGALLAGEMSGHIFYADKNYGYDDGLYAALRLTNFITQSSKSIDQLDGDLPRYQTSPEIRIPCDGAEKFTVIEKLQDYLDSQHIPFINEDGVRFESDQGFWLLRASNTQDLLILRFEGTDAAALDEMKQHFTEIIKVVAPEFDFSKLAL